ncbi:class I SAM-dependent methyltransferase [Tissierella sp.]|uniref:class I SAM-dependent methyltransferase n=1 Tax=Tissierella sp. TaxID=41274 RepID=UPI00302A1E76
MSMEKSIAEKSIFSWIEEKLAPIYCTSEEFIYNEMESQSGYSLPIIYKPFDVTKKSHWDDRGRMYDFLYSIKGEGKKLLDFGPGDGWPSLIVAPYAKEVIGVDSSEKRISVCKDNAKSLGITNAEFIFYNSEDRLPFEDNTFDGIMAASSIEQTPNPKKTIGELYRILKPGRSIRIYYEALSRYKDGFENDIWIEKLNKESCKLIIFDRNIKEEYVIQYGLTIAMSVEELISKLNNNTDFSQITISFLEEIKPKVTNALVLRTIHPSGKTYIKWFREAGFREVIPTYSGGIAASKLYDLYKEELPNSLELVDEAIKKTVKIVIDLKAPIEMAPMIIAVK